MNSKSVEIKARKVVESLLSINEGWVVVDEKVLASYTGELNDHVTGQIAASKGSPEHRSGDSIVITSENSRPATDEDFKNFRVQKPA